MNDDVMNALRAAVENDEELRVRLQGVRSESEFIALARDAGIALDSAEPETVDLTEAELAQVSGGIGLTFLPATNWIFCDNPWTDWYCSYKC